MNHTAVYHQQHTVHWAHQFYSKVGIDWLSWGKLCGD